MNQKEWNEGLNHLDLDLLEAYTLKKEFLRRKNKNMKRFSLRFGTVAACFALVLMGATLILPTVSGPHGSTATSQKESGLQEKLSEDNHLEKYYDYGINDGVFASYVGGKVIDESCVKSKLDDVIVTAGW